jgi:hypothetical protein
MNLHDGCTEGELRYAGPRRTAPGRPDQRCHSAAWRSPVEEHEEPKMK